MKARMTILVADNGQLIIKGLPNYCEGIIIPYNGDCDDQCLTVEGNPVDFDLLGSFANFAFISEKFEDSDCAILKLVHKESGMITQRIEIPEGPGIQVKLDPWKLFSEFLVSRMPPLLDNFTGFGAVRILDGDNPIKIAEGQSRIKRNKEYALEVGMFSSKPEPENYALEDIAITEGRDSEEIKWAIQIDVDTDGEIEGLKEEKRMVQFCFNPQEEVAVCQRRKINSKQQGEILIYVQFFTGNRFIQCVKLTLVVE